MLAPSLVTQYVSTVAAIDDAWRLQADLGKGKGLNPYSLSKVTHLTLYLLLQYYLTLKKHLLLATFRF